MDPSICQAGPEMTLYDTARGFRMAFMFNQFDRNPFCI